MSEPEFVFAPIHATKLVPADGDIYEVALTPACDFCLDTRVVWEYPCERFFITELRFGSDDNWLACERCAALIEQGTFANLNLRSVKSLLLRGEPVPDAQIDAMGQIQHGFFDHRTGPRFPYQPMKASTKEGE